ncbi:hypothetical protein ACM66B_004920 [Microbotryomycetes sp. NB124-2]
MQPSTNSFEYSSNVKEKSRRNRKGKQAVRASERSIDDKVQLRREWLERTGYLEQFRGELHVASSSKSQDQFVMLETLTRELETISGLSTDTSIFDPVFEDTDVEFLERARIKVLRSEHDLELSVTTLLFMPHCPRSLYELLLKKNWSRDKLRKIILLANRLDMYDDPTHSSASSTAKSPHISRAGKYSSSHEGRDDRFWSPPGDVLEEEGIDSCALSKTEVRASVKEEKDKLEKALIEALSRTAL